MRCPDLVMSAMSCHPRHRRSDAAREFWSFTAGSAGWQDADGGLHRRTGEWHMVELASRFPFASCRSILVRSIPLAARRQRKDGGFRPGNPGVGACQLVLAHARHRTLARFLFSLPYDPIPLIDSLDTPLGVKTRREALKRERGDDDELSRELVREISREQKDDGSWGGLIIATVQAIDDLLDCGVSTGHPSIRRACAWLSAQQRPVDRKLFAGAPSIELRGMFYTQDVRGESRYARRHPQWTVAGRHASCFTLLPIYQTGAALGALCRCGFIDSGAVRRGFADLLRIRGPGGRNYTNYWCACNVRRWLSPPTTSRRACSGR